MGESLVSLTFLSSVLALKTLEKSANGMGEILSRVLFLCSERLMESLFL
jgi:hypothetical protein